MHQWRTTLLLSIIGQLLTMRESGHRLVGDKPFLHHCRGLEFHEDVVNIRSPGTVRCGTDDTGACDLAGQYRRPGRGQDPDVEGRDGQCPSVKVWRNVLVPQVVEESLRHLRMVKVIAQQQTSVRIVFVLQKSLRSLRWSRVTPDFLTSR